MCVILPQGMGYVLWMTQNLKLKTRIEPKVPGS
jgi:hypothetical protein